LKLSGERKPPRLKIDTKKLRGGLLELDESIIQSGLTRKGNLGLDERDLSTFKPITKRETLKQGDITLIEETPMLQEIQYGKIRKLLGERNVKAGTLIPARASKIKTPFEVFDIEPYVSLETSGGKVGKVARVSGDSKIAKAFEIEGIEIYDKEKKQYKKRNCEIRNCKIIHLEVKSYYTINGSIRLAPYLLNNITPTTATH